ncbi:MAG: c-type cytochrome [Cytophagales bacterium]|nr:c-type cytochrome [Cytophagales bacterium]
MNKKRRMKSIGRFSYALFFALFLGVFSASAQEIPSDEAAIKAGEALFKANCKACHAMDKKLVGPALAGVTERRETAWLLKWINNAPALYESGDEIAVQLVNDHGGNLMSAFPTLKEEQILTFLAYAKAWKPIDEGSTNNDPKVAAQPQDNSLLVIVLSITLVILVLMIIVLVLLSATLTKQLKNRGDLDEAEEEYVSQRHNVIKALTHPGFIGLVSVIAVLVGLVLGIEKGLYRIGVQQGYAPNQPIAFSHKIHAGENKVDCNYCHTGVRKSKHANIPSPNICMNCHNQIKTESKEIQKIYKAIETGEPIKWVRVHNLPDLAYFNHSQHVKVGGIECQTCHGPIEEMEVVRQYSELTMGWCIDCHRKTAVNAEGNDYYENLLKVHNERGTKEAMTVEDIGGTECSKCHY